MKDGDIIYTIGNDLPKWFFKLYQEVTGCKITHVGIVLYGFFYESNITIHDNILIYGVRKSQITNYGSNHLSFKRELTELEKDLMYEYLEGQIGKPYNFMKLVNILWLRYLSWFWKLIGRTPKVFNEFGLICSEMVDKAYKSAGIDLIPELDEGISTPCDIFSSELLVKHE